MGLSKEELLNMRTNLSNQLTETIKKFHMLNGAIQLIDQQIDGLEREENGQANEE